MIADILFGFFMLGSFFVLGVGFWALGRLLRAKGHGPLLDTLDGRYIRLHAEVQLGMVPVGIKCSGLMKPDTLLGENTRQIEVSDDQTTPYLFR